MHLDDTRIPEDLPAPSAFSPYGRAANARLTRLAASDVALLSGEPAPLVVAPPVVIEE